MNKTYYEQGVENGEIRGKRKLIRELLEDRFGPLDPNVVNRLMNLPADGLTPLGCAVLRATSLKELGLTDD